MMNSQAKGQDSTLLAFVDGQLSPSQRSECLANIREDNRLGVYVFQLRHQKAVVQRAFSYETLPPIFSSSVIAPPKVTSRYCVLADFSHHQ